MKRFLLSFSFIFLLLSHSISQTNQELVVSSLNPTNCSSDDGRIAINLRSLGSTCEDIFNYQSILKSTTKITAYTTADINQDGKLDILYANAEKIAVLFNIGNGQYNEIIIDDSITRTSKIGFSDIDDDGDIDVVAKQSSWSFYYLLENETFTEFALYASDEYFVEVSSILASPKFEKIDIENDGDIDRLRITTNNFDDELVELRENDGSGNYTDRILLDFINRDIIDIKVFDYEGDGDEDIFLLYRQGTTTSGVEFHLNDGFGNFERITVYRETNLYFYELKIVDYNIDGKIDIIGAGPSNMTYINDINNTFIRKELKPVEGVTRYFEIFDVDLDGVNEPVYFDDYNIYWFTAICSSRSNTFKYEFSIDGGITFQESNVFNQLGIGQYQVVAREISNSSTIGFANNPINLTENKPSVISIDITDSEFCDDGNGKIAVNATSLKRTDSVFDEVFHIGDYASNYTDFDNDGDIDIIGVDDSRDNDVVYWYENLENGQFFRHFLTSLPWFDESIESVFPMDIDNDKDNDLVINLGDGEYVVVNDGEFNFEKREMNLVGAFDSPMPISVDIDLDGDLDIITEASQYNELAWHENTLDFSLGYFHFTRHKIFTGISEITKVIPIDFDNDNDIDFVVSTENRGSDDVLGGIYWFENDGNQIFESHLLISDIDVTFFLVEDYQEDNDYDIFYSAPDLEEIRILKNDGNLNFTDILIKEIDITYFDVDDYDMDGDLDIILNPKQNVSILQNQENQLFEIRVISQNESEFLNLSSWNNTLVMSEDLDHDGDKDILFNTNYILNESTFTESDDELSYSIDGGITFQNNSIFNNLAPSSYNLIIKNNDCSFEYETPIVISKIGDVCDNSESLIATATLINSISCNGLTDAIIEGEAIGGTAPYTYNLLDSNNTLVKTQLQGTFNDIAAGVYSLLIVDDNSKEATATGITVNQPNVLTLNISKTDVSCKGTNDGSLEIIVSGGTAPYEFSINGSAFISNNIFDILGPSENSVIVKDANGCTEERKIIIVELDTADFDNDGLGDACDDDIDGDGVENTIDICSETPLGSTVEADGCLKTPNIDSRVILFPNPIESGDITIALPTPYSGNAQLVLFSNIGTLLTSLTVEVVNGNLMLNMDGWASGVYSVRIETTEESFNQRIIKK
ncbi:FG-GAP-like repeat-containing protein [Zobellia russellii]|uniref:FG-GAP-like repeat-containing protein n=1 Tax=Zobellia russellii TaxID=248907 RepID=UPI0037DC8A50